MSSASAEEQACRANSAASADEMLVVGSGDVAVAWLQRPDEVARSIGSRPRSARQLRADIRSCVRTVSLPIKPALSP